jgi:CubicO group peptidase (beta-lactamase class C family)
VDDLREPQRRGPHVIVPADSPRPWPAKPTELQARIVGAGRSMDLEEFLAVTTATALVVVVDGTLVHERYLHGTTAEDRLLGNSATKSALALVVGRALDTGQLPGLDTTVTEWVPELADSGYATVNLRQLLTMTSGTDWLENLHDPDSAASRMLRRWRLGEGGLREGLTEIGPGDPPGTRYNYCTPDSLVLDWVRERATGATFAEAVAALWSVIEAEQPAVVGLDAPIGEGGIAMAGGSLAATARDWARIGTVQIDGRWGDQQVVSQAWVDASSRPAQDFLAPGRLPSRITTHAGFGSHWWPLDPAGERVMADGMRGQFVYIDRPRRTVVVKTSAWPYEDPWWDRQCRDLSYLALPAIAEAVRAG